MKKVIIFLFVLIFLGALVFLSYIFFFQDAYIIEKDFTYFKFHDQTRKPALCYVAGSQNCEQYIGYYKLIEDDENQMKIRISVTDSQLKISDIIEDWEIEGDIKCDYDYHGTKLCSYLGEQLWWVSENIFVQLIIEDPKKKIHNGMEQDLLEVYMEKYPSTI